ncbi:hypothetical protein AUP68_08164 [Ilyonectria robusta]
MCATYYSEQESFYRPRPQRPVTDVNILDTSLIALATTLKTLDLAPQTTKWRADQQLSCLPSLVALEHLRIGLPLLNSNDGFATRPLAAILPPRLKTLTINDWYAANRYEREDSEEEEYFFLQKNPLPHLRLLSLALDEFSQTCSSTHPFLRSVMFFGSFPIQALSFWTERDDLKQAGPRPGQFFIGGERVQMQSAESGVVFQEFLHAQECDYRFRDVHTLNTDSPREVDNNAGPGQSRPARLPGRKWPLTVRKRRESPKSQEEELETSEESLIRGSSFGCKSPVWDFFFPASLHPGEEGVPIIAALHERPCKVVGPD